MKFGVNLRNVKTGAEVYVLIFQISSLLTVLFFVGIPIHPKLMSEGGVVAALFDVGVSALPRGETLLLSLLYRLSSGEIITYFALLVFALAYGLLAGRLLKGDRRVARVSRVVLAALLGGDLLFRLVPLRFNIVFGWPATIFTFAVRLVCLIFIIMDLRADRKASEPRSA